MRFQTGLFLTLSLALVSISLAKADEGFLHAESSLPKVAIPAVEENICIKKASDPAGFDYNSLTISDKSQRFVEGPCSPLVIIPGVQGSKLQVNIDCETLSKENPDIFSSCGWNTCEDAPAWEFWKDKPDSQYTIWVPNAFTPMDILLNVVFPSCWGNLFTLEYDAQEAMFADRLKNPAGVTVQWYDQGTSSQECGLDAIASLMPSPEISELKGYFTYFQNMIQTLQGLGYITGVSLFATPYDWRRSPESDNTHYTITQTAKLASQLTGKKTVILSHSLGNMQALYTLNGMTQEEKDQYILHYIAIMPPYIGATEAADMLLGDNHFDPFGVGISNAELKSTSSTSTSLYDILPKATYETQANEPYMVDLLERMEAEQEHDPNTAEGLQWWQANGTKLPYQWFPTPVSTCDNGNINERNTTACIMGVQNWAEDVLIQVQDLSFSGTTNDMSEFVSSGIASLMSADYRVPLYEGMIANGIGDIVNPGVETTTIYGAMLRTTHSVEYDYNPAEELKNGDSATPTIMTFELGDGTVPVSSALLGALKWSWEYEHRESEEDDNIKPMHILEWCSSYDEGTLEFNQNETTFSGLWCECMASSQSGTNCDHMKSVTDPNMINWVSHFLSETINPVSNGVNPLAGTLSDSALQNIATTCPSLNTLPSDAAASSDFAEQMRNWNIMD